MKKPLTRTGKAFIIAGICITPFSAFFFALAIYYVNSELFEQMYASDIYSPALLIESEIGIVGYGVLMAAGGLCIFYGYKHRKQVSLNGQ